MIWRTTVLVTCAAWLACAGLDSPAWAQRSRRPSPSPAAPAPAAPEAAAKDRASALLSQGNAKLDAGLYVEALALFEQAFAAYPSPKLHFNLAQTLYELGRHAEALRHYERFVRDVAEREMPTQWARANGRIFELEGKIATITVQCSELGASLKVDGEPAGQTPLREPLRLSPGRHVLLLDKPGFERHVLELELRGGQARTERVELLTTERALARRAEFQRAEAARTEAERKLRAEVAARQRATARRRSLVRTSGWVALGVGVAAAASAGVTALLWRREDQTIADAAPGTPWLDLAPHYDRADTYRTASYVTAAVGAAALVGGASLLLYSRTFRSDETRAKERAAWLPLPLPGGAGLALQGGF